MYSWCLMAGVIAPHAPIVSFVVIHRCQVALPYPAKAVRNVESLAGRTHHDLSEWNCFAPLLER